MPVEFNDEHQQQVSALYTQLTTGPQARGLAKWVMDKGWAKSPQQANFLLVIVAVVAFAVAIFFAVSTIQGPDKSLSEADQQLMELNNSIIGH